MARKKAREQELDTLQLEVPKEEMPRVSLEGCEILDSIAIFGTSSI